jgi:hypothetical protein
VQRTSSGPQEAANDPELRYRTGVLRWAISFRIDERADAGNPFGKPENPGAADVFLPPMPPPDERSGEGLPAGDVEAPPNGTRAD